MSEPGSVRSVRSLHDRLNGTAVPHRPDPHLLPPLGPEATRVLPEPRLPDAPLHQALAQRRSRYAFGSHQPSLPDLASLLLLGIGTAPRAGGLPSVVPHLVVRGPGELPVGVHRVDLRQPLPGLVEVRSGDPTAYLAASLDQPPFAARVPVWVALCVDLGTTLTRYPARHYRTLHLDAGVAMQGLLLVATGLGLATCPVMGYDDAAWELLLDLPEDVLVAGVVAVGVRPTAREHSLR